MKLNTLIKELEFKALPSGGPGGQHANKVSSKVQLSFNVLTSAALSKLEKQVLRQQLQNQINTRGQLQLACSTFKSQHKNKAAVTKRLITLITKSLIAKKLRKPTKITKAAKQKRLHQKKQQALKKINRQKPLF